MQVATKVSHTFSASLKWNEEAHIGVINSGRRGQIVFTTPPEFGGSQTEWSPEHLLAASLSSCYATTFCYFIKLLKVKVNSFAMDVTMDVEKEGNEPFTATRFILRPKIEFTGNPGRAVIDNLLSKAKRYCIISNSVKGEVVVEPEITFA